MQDPPANLKRGPTVLEAASEDEDPFHVRLHELSRKLSTLSPATFEVERAKNKNLENVDDADGVCSGHSTSR